VQRGSVRRYRDGGSYSGRFDESVGVEFRAKVSLAETLEGVQTMATVLNSPEPVTQKVILHNVSWDTYLKRQGGDYSLQAESTALPGVTNRRVAGHRAPGRGVRTRP
jgi:hypothetical protein